MMRWKRRNSSQRLTPGSGLSHVRKPRIPTAGQACSQASAFFRKTSPDTWEERVRSWATRGEPRKSVPGVPVASAAEQPPGDGRRQGPGSHLSDAPGFPAARRARQECLESIPHPLAPRWFSAATKLPVALVGGGPLRDSGLFVTAGWRQGGGEGASVLSGSLRRRGL